MKEMEEARVVNDARGIAVAEADRLAMDMDTDGR